MQEIEAHIEGVEHVRHRFLRSVNCDFVFSGLMDDACVYTFMSMNEMLYCAFLLYVTYLLLLVTYFFYLLTKLAY